MITLIISDLNDPLSELLLLKVCFGIVLGTRLTDCTSNSNLYEKCGYNERKAKMVTTIFAGKDDRLPKIVLVGQAI